MGVGKKVLEPIRKWVETLDGQAIIGDNLSPLELPPVGDTDDTDTTDRGVAEDTSRVTPVSPDPSDESSENPDPSESADSGASEADDEWLAETRLADPEGESEMTPEEKAEMAAPGASADLQPIPPPEAKWATKWRDTLRVRYQHGFTMEHVLAWVERFADPDHANLTPPTKKGDAADWHGGALAFLNRCHEDYVANMDGQKASPDLTLRRAVWCLDYFYWRREEGDAYYQHEVTRPGSLSNRTVAILARDLRELQDKHSLDPDDMPTVHHLVQEQRGKGAKRGKRRVRSPEDEREKAERQRRYDGGIPDELQTANVLARAAEQRAAASQERQQGNAAQLPDVQGDGSSETGRADST